MFCGLMDDPTFSSVIGSFCETITIPPTQQVIIYYNKTLPLFNNPTFLKGIFDLQFAYIITYLERTSIVSGGSSGHV